MKSVVSYPERGCGGSSHYRGNCSPGIIQDLIDFYRPKHISDYMVGSGTTKDVAIKNQFFFRLKTADGNLYLKNRFYIGSFLLFQELRLQRLSFPHPNPKPLSPDPIGALVCFIADVSFLDFR